MSRQQLLRPARRPGRRRRIRRAPAADGLLHRHLGVHRLQGMRGRVQGVERGARRRVQPAGHVVRQHRRAGRELVAARGVHRAARRGSASISGMPGFERPGDATGAETRQDFRWLMSSRRLQALHPCGVPGRVPDGRAVPHRVRHGRCAAGHLQRLRLLRLGLSVRRDRAARGRRPGLEVHDVLRPAARRAGAGLREGVPDGLDPVRGARRVAGAGRAARRRTARAGRGRGAAVRRGPQRRRRRRRARSFCCSTSRRCTGCRRTRWCRRATRARCGATRGWRPRRWSGIAVSAFVGKRS